MGEAPYLCVECGETVVRANDAERWKRERDALRSAAQTAIRTGAVVGTTGALHDALLALSDTVDCCGSE